jgi:hypothetical protein
VGTFRWIFIGRRNIQIIDETYAVGPIVNGKFFYGGHGQPNMGT